MVRIVSLVAVAVASFSVACAAPAEEDADATADQLVTATAADLESCELVGVYTKAAAGEVQTIKASELPKSVRPRVGLAKTIGKLTVGEREAYLIEDTSTKRFFNEDGVLIARGVMKGTKTKWSGTTGEALTCPGTISKET